MTKTYRETARRWAISSSGESGIICGFNSHLKLLVMALTDGSGWDYSEGAEIVTHPWNRCGYQYVELDDVILFAGSVN